MTLYRRVAAVRTSTITMRATKPAARAKPAAKARTAEPTVLATPFSDSVPPREPEDVTAADDVAQDMPAAAPAVDDDSPKRTRKRRVEDDDGEGS